MHYQKVQIHLGANLKVLDSVKDPFSTIKKLKPSAFIEDSDYKVTYLYDID